MMMVVKSKLSWLIWLVVIGLGIPLILSIFSSGYRYQFDIDELHHAHLVYLYHLGLTPYKDIYNSVYTPFLEWLLTPIFIMKGFSFDAVYAARFLMIALFIIRVTATVLLAQIAFGIGVGLLFLPLFLLDPFVVFSSMQIRPDNLMMTLWSIGLLLFARALIRKNKPLFFLSGILVTIALLTLIKILPSFIVLVVTLGSLGLISKSSKEFFWFIGGVAIALAAFILYFASQGALPELIKQFAETKTAYNVFRYPVPVGNFYLPNNLYVFGSPGKPLPWIYVWILPLLAAAGVYETATGLLGHRLQRKDSILIVLILSLATQWFSLFPLPVVFMQHYLPISWLLSLFAAVAIWHLILKSRQFNNVHLGVILLLTMGFTVFALASITANTKRSLMESSKIIAKYQTYWQKIPSDKGVFPGLLFRPSVYPVPFGYYFGNVPDPILDRLPPIPQTLEAQRVPFLLVDDYLFSLFKPDIQSYITRHYVRVSGDPELWRRIE